MKFKLNLSLIYSHIFTAYSPPCLNLSLASLAPQRILLHAEAEVLRCMFHLTLSWSGDKVSPETDDMLEVVGLENRDNKTVSVCQCCSQSAGILPKRAWFMHKMAVGSRCRRCKSYGPFIKPHTHTTEWESSPCTSGYKTCLQILQVGGFKQLETSSIFIPCQYVELPHLAKL